MRKLLLSLILIVVAQMAIGQAAKNVTLVGHLSNPSGLSDCWGYEKNGREYAIIGIMSGGVGIVDLQNPANPVLLQTLPGTASTWYDMVVEGDYCYNVNEAADGLKIIDLSNLPGQVTWKDTIIAGMNTAHNVYVDNGYLYTCGADNNGGINILDLTDPWRPNLVGQYFGNYVHDVYVRNDYAYACELSSGLTIINVSNKTSPVIAANRPYPGNFTHNSWLNDNGDVVFTTDETGGGKITSFDISDLNNIELLDDTWNELGQGASIPHNTHVRNDFLITSWYTDGLSIIDAARPHNLIDVGYYDTSPFSGSSFSGAWGAYHDLPSGLVLISDTDDGLFIFQPSYTRGCYLEGEVTDANTTNPILDANIEILTTSVTDKSDANGDYATGTADAGTYQVKYSKFGYQDTTISVALTNGQLVVRDIALRPVATVQMTINVIEQGTGNPIGQAKVLAQEINGLAELDYTANGGGQVIDPAFVGGTYNIVAGKWGYRSKLTNVSVNQAQTITVELEKGYYDDFALDFGWVATGNATTGLWERGEPIGTFGFGNQPFNPEDDIFNDIIDKCYVTGNGGGGVGDDDIDDGEVILTSPVFDLSNYTEPFLSYWHWQMTNQGGAPEDEMIVEIDNGLTTVRLATIVGQNNFWDRDTFTVSNFIAPTANMVLRVRASDTSPQNISEAAFDGFEIVDNGPVSIDVPDPASVTLTAAPNPIGPATELRYDFGMTTLPASARFEVRDLSGKLVYSRMLDGTTGSFKLGLDVASGVYMGTLKTGNATVKTIKLMK